MAKKKVEAFEKAGQGYYIIGEVKDASKEEKTSNDGNITWMEYRARIKTPEGVTIFVKNNRYEATEEKPEHSFKTESFEYWESLIETDYSVKSNRDFVSVKGNKKSDIKMFNWLTNFEKDDGQISYNIDNLISHIDYTVGEDEVVTLNFQKGDSIFKDRKTTFNATMYIGEIEGDKLFLTDGKVEYPNTLTVELDEGMENKAVLGQGYKFRLRLEKGKKAQVESGTANWGDEGSSGAYDPDKLIVEAVESFIKDMKLGSVVSSKKSKSTKTEVKEDELPF